MLFSVLVPSIQTFCQFHCCSSSAGCESIDQDGAEPSGNSVSVSNLVRLSLLLDCGEYRDKAGRILQLFHQRLSRVPVALPAMVSALIMYEDSPTEVKAY